MSPMMQRLSSKRNKRNNDTYLILKEVIRMIGFIVSAGFMVTFFSFVIK